MILFYAQSGNNEVIVTSPKLTFPAQTSSGNSTSPVVYAVQPLKYTMLDGTVKQFVNTDIEKFVYQTRNNGHRILKIKFSKTFPGRAGCTLTLRASFLTQDRFQTFTLPFTESTALANTSASTEALAISVSASGAKAPVTSYKTFINSSLVDEPTTAFSSGVGIDTNDYPNAATGVLEFVGATIDSGASGITGEQLHDIIKKERTKFLSTPTLIDPNQNVAPYANYFYIYAEECDKSQIATEGCFHSTADNASSNTGISVSNNSCIYARRAPNNTTIEHVPGGKTTLAKVSWFEEFLPQDTDIIDGVDDFDVHKVQTLLTGIQTLTVPSTTYTKDQAVVQANGATGVVHTTVTGTSVIVSVTAGAFETTAAGGAVTINSVTRAVSAVVNGYNQETPTSETINIDGDNTSVLFEWDDIDSDSDFTRVLYSSRDKAGIVLSSNVGSSDDNRVEYFAIFRTQSAGCTDSNALNFDTNAAIDDGSCVFCDNVVGQVSKSIAFEAVAYSNATALNEQDDVDIRINSTITDLNSTLLSYITTLADTIWTCKIYKAEDITLNAYGEAATSGTEVESFTNAGSPTIPLFTKTPTTRSGFFTGTNYIAEIILTIGSCVHYFYKPFGVPFNGCLDPTSTNYVPNALNTGKGNCDYDVANRSFCDGTISTSDPVGELVATLGVDIWNAYIVINGTYDEYGNSLNDEESPNYDVTTEIYGDTGDLLSTTSDTYLGGADAQSISYALTSGQYVNIVITDLSTGCAVTVVNEFPVGDVIEGCTDPTALNYNPNATENNGSCLYCTDVELTATATAATGACSTTNSDGVLTFAVTGATAFQIYWAGPTPLNGYVEIDYVSGNDLIQTGLGPGIYNAYAIVTLAPDVTCQVPLSNYPAYITVNTSGCGCMDPLAENYDSTATEDDGSCIVRGCTNSLAVNYNPAATVDDQSCVYSAVPSEPMCIPSRLDNEQAYTNFLDGVASCVAGEGKTLLLKIKGGIACDTVDQVKLSLLTYLLNRIGLECLYNCNYIFPHPDKAVSCSGKWAIGGPSGKELVFATGTTYVQGDIFKFEDFTGVVHYYEVLISFTSTNVPPTSEQLRGKIIRCENITLPSGTETYLNTFINFARKFCTVCLVEPQSKADVMQATKNTLNDIQLEDGDNIELNG